MASGKCNQRNDTIAHFNIGGLLEPAREHDDDLEFHFFAIGIISGKAQGI